MTLALLLTAVGGAWAQTETLLTTITATAKEQASYSTANVATVSFSYTEEGYSVYSDRWGWWGYGFTATVTAAEGYTITKCVFYDNDGATATDSTDPFIVETTEEEKTPQVNGATFGAFTSAGIKKIEVYGYVTPTPSAEPGIEVTTNAASEQDLFTEAKFTMPAFDATADYELVRDMSVQMTATMGDGTDGVRYRVKKVTDNAYAPADMDMMQVLGLVAVNDGIEQKALTLNQDYFCRIYKLDEQTLQPAGDGVLLADFDFAPGLYALKAFAEKGSNYDGETALSNTFVLFQGYELEIAAGEFATYYKDEALYVEDEDAQLYTITTVGNETATATELTVAAANTPLLVKNNAAEAKTILLIPTTTATPDDVTPYEGFKGTLEATQIAASTATQNNYALNGKEFVWVMDAIDIAANRAWLETSATTTNSRALQIVFGDVTGMSEELRVKSEEFATAQWYDLNGRKLQAAPTKKGVYILNGKKVVVK